MVISSNCVRGKMLFLSIIYMTDYYFYYHSYRRRNHRNHHRRLLLLLLLLLLLRHQKLTTILSILYLWGDITLVCQVLNGLCETIGNRLHCRHFRLQARWQSVLVRLQSSVSSSRCWRQNCWSWLVLSTTQHPELHYGFISQTAFAMYIRVSNRTFHKRKPVEWKIVIKSPK